MAIKVTKFVWENEPKKDTKPRKAPAPEIAKVTDEYINLTKDGTIKVRRSTYTEDMMGK